MKKILSFCVFLCLGVFLGVISPPTKTPTQYRSAWVTLQPGELYSFTHPLNKQPDLLFVWTKVGVGEDIETIRPFTEFPGLISIQDVSTTDVRILNLDDSPWTLSIFVR